MTAEIRGTETESETETETESDTPSETFDARFAAAYAAVVDRWPLAVESITLESESGATHVNACGPVDAPPLVLLHGGGTTAAVWYANAADLAREHRVYAVDRIGEAGLSRPGVRPPRDVDGLHAWLDGVLDGLGIARTAICGHSYGAWLALTYTLHAPERVGGLVLLDPTQCFGGYRPGYLLRALPSLVRPTAERARRFVAWETAGVAAAETPPGDVAAWLELHGLAAEFPGRKTVVGRRPKRAELRTLTTPTRVILAARSRTHDADAIAAAASRDLADAEVSVLPDVSHHAMPWHRAAELDAEIAEFLAAMRPKP